MKSLKQNAGLPPILSPPLWEWWTFLIQNHPNGLFINLLTKIFFRSIIITVYIKGEDYPAVVCKWASSKITNCDIIADEIIEKRKDKIHYLGDLYDTNK